MKCVFWRVLSAIFGAVVRFCRVRKGHVAPDKFPLHPQVSHVLVLEEPSLPAAQTPWNAKTDEWWHTAVSGLSPTAEVEWLQSEDRSFLLYTSGSTGKPKGVVHTIGEHAGTGVGELVEPRPNLLPGSGYHGGSAVALIRDTRGRGLPAAIGHWTHQNSMYVSEVRFGARVQHHEHTARPNVDRCTQLTVGVCGALSNGFPASAAQVATWWLPPPAASSCWTFAPGTCTGALRTADGELLRGSGKACAAGQ